MIDFQKYSLVPMGSEQITAKGYRTQLCHVTDLLKISTFDAEYHPKSPLVKNHRTDFSEAIPISKSIDVEGFLPGEPLVLAYIDEELYEEYFLNEPCLVILSGHTRFFGTINNYLLHKLQQQPQKEMRLPASENEARQNILDASLRNLKGVKELASRFGPIEDPTLNAVVYFGVKPDYARQLILKHNLNRKELSAQDLTTGVLELVKSHKSLKEARLELAEMQLKEADSRRALASLECVPPLQQGYLKTTSQPHIDALNKIKAFLDKYYEGNEKALSVLELSDKQSLDTRFGRTPPDQVVFAGTKDEAINNPKVKDMQQLFPVADMFKMKVNYVLVVKNPTYELACKEAEPLVSIVFSPKGPKAAIAEIKAKERAIKGEQKEQSKTVEIPDKKETVKPKFAVAVGGNVVSNKQPSKSSEIPKAVATAPVGAITSSAKTRPIPNQSEPKKPDYSRLKELLFNTIEWEKKTGCKITGETIIENLLIKSVGTEILKRLDYRADNPNYTILNFLQEKGVDPNKPFPLSGGGTGFEEILQLQAIAIHADYGRKFLKITLSEIFGNDARRACENEIEVLKQTILSKQDDNSNVF